MGLYKFKEKGPAYGLGYTEGELIELKDGETIHASCLVNEIHADGQAKGQPTGKMIMATKEYTVDYLIEHGVIIQANVEDKKKVSTGTDKNALAEEKARKDAAREAKIAEAAAKKLEAKANKLKDKGEK